MTLRKQILKSQPICVADGERSLRSKVRAQASFFPHPQRHDPSAAPSLIVTKNTGLFTLLEIHDGIASVAVKAPAAQMIQDYINANWPVGTIAHWIVVPPFRPVRAESADREVGRGVYGVDPGLCLHSSARAFSLREALRLSLICLVIAIIFRLLFQIVNAQDVVPPTLGTSNIKHQTLNIAAALAFHFSDGEERQWLRIENHDPRTKDFHPSLTNIVCDYKPIVRKLGPNKYEITFVSEIAEDLP